VLIYLGPLEHGGTIRAITRLRASWTIEGTAVSLMTFGGVADSSVSAAEHRANRPTLWQGMLEHSALGMVRSASSLGALLRQVRRVIRDRPEAAVLPFLTGTALVTLAATIGLPNRVIVCERTDVSRHRVGWHVRLLRRLLYPRAAAITVNSTNPAASDLLRKISRGRPVHVVPNPHPREMQLADPANSRVILAVGRLVDQKQHATLIEAFATIADRIPEWRVVIVGDGPLRGDLEAQIDRLDLSDRVTLAGQVEDPRPFYASAGLFVLPSNYEGTSNALLEAASAGLPCIVTTTSSPTTSPDAFRIFHPGDVKLLANHLHELCTDADDRRAEGTAARMWLQSEESDALQAWRAVLNIKGPS
jgi:glycosyltransferase involved in cell wall biosynthesis